MNTHTLKARQRNDRALAANEQKLENIAARIATLQDEQTDLMTEQRALLAEALVYRDNGGQL